MPAARAGRIRGPRPRPRGRLAAGHRSPPEPFADDTASASIGGLTVENGTDRIALYGNLDITRDTAGLKLAGELARFLDQAIATMAADKALPEHVAPPAKPTTVRNPFT